jgi:hypothetical protein
MESAQLPPEPQKKDYCAEFEAQMKARGASAPAMRP